jgi:hypothetical protein
MTPPVAVPFSSLLMILLPPSFLAPLLLLLLLPPPLLLLLLLLLVLLPRRLRSAEGTTDSTGKVFPHPEGPVTRASSPPETAWASQESGNGNGDADADCDADSSFSSDTSGQQQQQQQQHRSMTCINSSCSDSFSRSHNWDCRAAASRGRRDKWGSSSGPIAGLEEEWGRLARPSSVTAAESFGRQQGRGRGQPRHSGTFISHWLQTSHDFRGGNLSLSIELEHHRRS